MLTTKEIGLLIAIVKHCSYIEEKLPNLSFDEFATNEDLIRLMCFSILQIGDLAKHFEPEFVTQYSAVPWKEMMGMRDKVAHGYDTIKVDKVWQTVQNDIVPLHNYCNLILEENK